MDGDSSNPFRNTGVEVVQAQEHKLDRWGQVFDCLYQAIIDLNWLMDDTNKNHKEERYVLRDLPQADLTFDLFLKFHRDNHLSMWEEFGEHEISKLSNHKITLPKRVLTNSFSLLTLSWRRIWQTMIFKSWMKILQIRSWRTW